MQNKMELLMEKLKTLAKVQAERPAGPPLTKGGQGRGEDFRTRPVDKPVETVADDGNVDANKQAEITRTEAVLRPALKLFGVDYDALIRMDGKSAYAQAVAAKPGVVEEVLQSENPVLAALEVAQAFAPYAAFTQKYGNEPKAIRENIAKEVRGEEAEPLAPPAAEKGMVFSGKYGGRGVKPAAKKADLGSIFKR